MKVRLVDDDEKVVVETTLPDDFNKDDIIRHRHHSYTFWYTMKPNEQDTIEIFSRQNVHWITHG